MMALSTDSDPVAGINRRLAAWQVVAGAIGLAAAFVLTLEKLATLRDPSYVPSCSINPVLSCGSIMASTQASAFGFPNPLIGLLAFPVVITIGVVRLAGVVLPRWLQVAFAIGTIVGAGFVHWLIVVSLYQVHALCPYCLAVWIITIPLAWYTSLDTFRPMGTARRFHSAILTAWFAVVVVLVFFEFQDYWLSLA